MNLTSLVRAIAPAALGLMMVSGAAQALTINLPAESAVYKESALPGYALVQRNCMTCHSAHYAQMQPPLPRSYWEATVKKMVKPFGARIDETEIPAMVDYLVDAYGIKTPLPTASK